MVCPRFCDRYIPVPSADDGIMTCYLEDAGHSVLVRDLVHHRGATGWTLHKSAYAILKLPLEDIKDQLREVGLTVSFETTRRGA